MLNKGNNGSLTAASQQTSPKKSKFVQKSLLVLAFGLFAGAAAIAVVQPHEEPIIYQATQALELPAGITPLGQKSTEPFIHETRIRRGDTLAALLQRLQVEAPGLQAFLTHDKNARSIYKLYPGRSLQVALNDENDLLWLRYVHTPADTSKGETSSKWLEIRPDEKGGYTASEESLAVETHIQMAEGVIRSSLFGATDAANIPDAVALQIPEILGSKVDFMKDLRKDDRFRVVYETYSHNGQRVGAGKVLALEFENQGKVHDALWFDLDDKGGSYYDFAGVGSQGAFLRNALKFTRISSTFGGRRHPVHGSWRNHNGVDYAAPTGTPIHATADGVVKSIGSQRGYGNTIVLEHHSGYSTLYAHQSRFADGLKQGDTVSQGQLIGYVGSTGWSTGPHLHYEFRINNKPVDPLSVELPVARVLSKEQKASFETAVSQYRAQFAVLKGLGEPVIAAIND